MSRPVALIPARGGSKRFPRKNITLLQGRPLLAWTIEPALASGVFDEVIVTSDDEEVLAVAARHGAAACMRPPALAGDTVTVDEVCLDFVRAEAGRRPLYVLLPTSPLRSPETIRQAWSTFVESGADALVSVVPLEHPPQWALAVRGGSVEPLDPLTYPLARGELERAYRHDGGHVILDACAYVSRGRMFGGRTIPFVPPSDEVADVDEPLDLAWVEFLLARRGPGAVAPRIERSAA